jgi:hypothetical protein
MKNFNFTYLLTCLVISSLISCQKDDNFVFSPNNISENIEISLVNNRLSFSSKEQLTEIFNEYSDATDEKLYNFLKSFYNDDFLSLRPPVTKENEEFIYDRIMDVYGINDQLYKQSSRTTSTQNSVLTEESILDDIDDLEDIIGDDTFAAFLNSDAEIQVENEIYKYTDVGLFVVPVNNYEALGIYLSENYISAKLTEPTDEEIIVNYVQNNSSPTLQIVEDDAGIQYYGSVCGIGIDNPDCTVSSSTGGSGSTSTTTPVDPLDGLQAFVDGLQPCSPSSGIFGDIFGTNRVCKDKYESKRRVKTKAFNYDYYIVYHAGVKVKHQYKGWTGLWRKESTDVVAIGASRIQYDYDINPVLSSALSGLNLFETKISSKKYGKQWTFNTNSYTGIYGYLYINSQTTFSDNLYPIAVQDDLVIETFTNNVALDYALEFANDQLIKEKLNEYFWSGAQQATKWAVKEFLTFDSNYEVPKSRTLAFKSPQYGRILVQKSVFQNCFDCKKVDKTIDFGFTLKATIKPENNWSINPSDGDLFLKPKRFGASLYGAIKRNGQWHGSLIDF